MAYHCNHRADGRQLQIACAAHFAWRADTTLANWGLMAANLPAFRAVPDLPLPRLLGEMPAFHTALVALLALPADDPSLTGAERILFDASARHARCRFQDRFPISSLLDDLAMLRDLLLTTAADWATNHGLLSPPETLIRRLMATLDSTLSHVCEAWVGQVMADLAPEPITTAS